jgi:hypothetical protein
MGKISLDDGIAFPFELLHGCGPIDGLSHHARVGDQIEAAGLMGECLAAAVA